MAHPEQIEFCSNVKELYPKYFKDTFVLDIGSLDINGNNQYLFNNCKYLGVDIGEGKNVDIVQKAHELAFPDETFDIIISTEMLEHDMYYEKSIKNIYRMLKPGGLVVLTCATEGRAEHGTKRSEPESAPLLQGITEWQDYYKNLIEDDINIVFDNDIEKYFYKHQFLVNHNSHDLYFWGIKNGIYIKRENLSHQIRNIKNEILDYIDFDKEYYIQNNIDLQNSDINLLDHYVYYGVHEKRFPNTYTEQANINLKDVPFLEILFSKIKDLANELNIQKNRTHNLNSTINELSSVKADLENDLNAKVSEIGTLNQSIQDIHTNLENITQSKVKVETELNTQIEQNSNLVNENSSLNLTISELSSVKADLENDLNAKVSEIGTLNQSIQDIHTNLENITQSKVKVETELNTQIEQNSNLVNENSNLNLTISELSSVKADLENDLNAKVSEVESLNENIEDILKDLLTIKQSKIQVETELNTQIEQNSNLVNENSNLNLTISELSSVKADLENDLNAKVSEIESLNIQIDQIVSDLASIKESKCWIYTKPIRNLQKKLKGNK